MSKQMGECSSTISPLGLLLREVPRCQWDLPVFLRWIQSFFPRPHRAWENNPPFQMPPASAHLHCSNKGFLWRIVTNEINGFSSPPPPVRAVVGCSGEEAGALRHGGSGYYASKLCAKKHRIGWHGSYRGHNAWPFPPVYIRGHSYQSGCENCRNDNPFYE